MSNEIWVVIEKARHAEPEQAPEDCEDGSYDAGRRTHDGLRAFATSFARELRT